ncbi:RING finger protein 214 [Pygocentrus nattereri]|uniref:Ring finger protein 214 n=1 Tax=Pygocentrus nattereri TaxID=42514 RepID=A0AAR2JUU2_PYGNA|nr:RING finger protein 214 [Pygocentrus nattereri]XP_017569359.1 RING finger protein 214 [Pygocentrus nattereri]
MESDAQTEWSLALGGDLVAGDEPVCAPFWSVRAPATLWPVPGLLGAPVAEEDASPGRCELAAMPKAQDQDTQTEDWTEEKGSNTSDDWVAVMRSIDEYSSRLQSQYESLLKQEDTDQTGHALLLESLKKTRDEKKRQHQILLDKIESLQVKLELNSSKTTRKNFSAKLEELTAERDRLAEGKRRLTQELEEADRKLKQLTEEQNNEKLSWEQEIADLQERKERLSKQVEEDSQMALKDEVQALESQRLLAIAHVEDWLAEAERYLSNLRMEQTPQHGRQRIEWEKNVVIVRNSLTKLQNMYNENIKLLQSGQQLNSLPPVSLPSLPVVPTIELFMSPLRNLMQMAYYGGPMVRIPPPSEFHLAGAPAHRVTPPLSYSSSQNHSASTMTSSSHAVRPKPQLSMPTSLPPQPPFRMPVMPSAHPLPPPHTLPHTIAPAGTHGGPGPAQVSTAATHIAVSTATAQAAGLPAQAAAGRQHGTLTAAPARNASSYTVLERLERQFPQCTRPQLMSVLQQIKSERGTMAGMSIDKVMQQVSQRLAQNDRPPPGPIAPPGSRVFAGPLGPVQRPSVQPMAVHPPIRTSSASVFQPRPAQAPPVRKLCLMCQNHVEPGTQYNTNCPHTLHKECISVWLKSSKDHSCPFCPSK